MEEQSSLAQAALKAKEEAEALAASLLSEQAGIDSERSVTAAAAKAAEAAAAQAQAQAQELQAKLEAAQTELAEATTALALAEESALNSKKEVGVWRHRARLWKRRADTWFRGAPSSREEEDAAGEESVDLDGGDTGLAALALIALADRQRLAVERDSAVAKWTALLEECAQLSTSLPFALPAQAFSFTLSQD